MLFNSAVFIILFFAVYLLYWHLNLSGKHSLIILASFVFYGWFSLPFLLLFIFLIVVNYYVSLKLLENKSRTLLALTVGLDIGVLAFFKYFYLFAEGIGLFLVGTGIFPEADYLLDLRKNWLAQYNFQIILPIAISFYTFQIVAWVVDSYRGTIEEKVPFKKFCVFILFFPQFVAGPIMRSTDFLPQIDNPTPTRDRMLNGSLLILQGIIKKVLIADRLGALTLKVWNNPSQYDGAILILILPAFIAQVYCDFSGYTDMARGLAKLLGYEIPENFNGPYLSRSMSELWQRWHVTLSTWLRDYIYIPLGGSRQGNIRTSVNLLATMGLAGLWHGANWTMIVWGLYMGLFLVIERTMRIKGIRILPETKWADALRVFWTFCVFTSSGLFFRAPSIGHAYDILAGIFTFQRAEVITGLEAILSLTIIGCLFNYPQYYPRVKNFLNARVGLRYALVLIFTFLVGFLVNLFGDVSGSFIYFAF